MNDTTLQEPVASETEEAGEEEPKSKLVYKFGLPFGPVSNEQYVREQMFIAHRYRNLLTQAENLRRDQSREAEMAYDLPRLEAEFQAAKQELADAQDQVKIARAKASRPKTKGGKATKKRAVPPELMERVAEAKKAKKVAQDAWHERRGELALDTAVMAKRDVLNEWFSQRTRQLRNESSQENDLYSGSYLLVERAFKAARQSPLYFKGEPKDLKRVYWEGEGRIGIQVQSSRKFDLSKIFEPNLFAWIDPVNEKAWNSKIRGEQREYAKTILHMRVGSDDKGHPIWADFPMIMHRQFPKDAKVTWVSINLVRIGPREQWSVDFTLDTTLSPAFKVCGTGRVAVNLGWRTVPEGIRVATMLDEAGNQEYFVLDHRMLESLRLSDTLRSRRDLEFDQAKLTLADWVRSRKMPAYIPGWMQRAVMDRSGKRITLGLWKSQARLAALCNRWKNNRFDGDSVGDEAVEAWKDEINQASHRRRKLTQKLYEDWRDAMPSTFASMSKKEIAERRLAFEQVAGKKIPKPPVPAGLAGYAALEAWRYHDWHLWIWQESARKKALRHRKWIFRNLGAKLASRYGTLVLHKMDMRDFQRRQAPEAEKAENETARTNRHTVAVAELRDCLAHGFVSRRGQVDNVPSENITQTCSDCGMEEPFEAADQVMHTCSHCGARWDQDVNACKNILMRHRERSSDPKPPVTARTASKDDDGETKWQKAQRKAKERRARIEAARNEQSTAAE
jgi:hypothetical protein